MYISIIPTSKSQGKLPYSYFVSPVWDNQIRIGWVVEIPYGKDIILGIISSIEEIPPTNISIQDIRPIHSVVSITPILDADQISVIQKISQRYFLPIHKSLSLFLPTSLIRRIEKRNYVLSRNFKDDLGKLDSITIHHYIKYAFSPKDLKKYLQPQSVIIFPDDMMLFSFLEWQKKEDTILFIPTEATITKRTQAWIDIYEQKYEIIVWTRRLLYYNLSAYKNIIYIEDAFGGEQFQYPTSIRSLDVLCFISNTHSYNITVVSSSPSLELFAKFPKSKIHTIK